MLRCLRVLWDASSSPWGKIGVAGICFLGMDGCATAALTFSLGLSLQKYLNRSVNIQYPV